MQSPDTVEDPIMDMKTRGGGLLLRLAQICRSHSRGSMSLVLLLREGFHNNDLSLVSMETAYVMFFSFFFISSLGAQLLAFLHQLSMSA